MNNIDKWIKTNKQKSQQMGMFIHEPVYTGGKNHIHIIHLIVT